MRDYDGPWKEALELAFDLFLALFFPAVYALVDWTYNFESLEQELQKLAPDAPGAAKRVDKLFHVLTHNGDPVLAHVEAQMHRDADFPERMFVYGYRGRDRFRQPLVSIAVLGDDDPGWKPTSYTEGRCGCQTTYSFLHVKLVEWADRLAELEGHPNPFALFVAAYLHSRNPGEGDDADQARVQAKVRLLTNLLGRGLSEPQQQCWYRLIDWVFPLPEAGDRQVWEQMRLLKEGPPVTFVTYAERYGLEKGLEKGLEQGLEKGLEKGLEQGREQGEQKGMLRSVRSVLKARFQAEGAALGEAIPEDADVARLEALLQAASTAVTLDEIRARMTPAT